MSPSGSPFPKTSAFILLFYPLIQVYTDNKVIDKDKYPYNLLYSKNTKNKADIKNKNNEVLGKGERERENRFYEHRFPSRKKNKTPKKSARGRTDFTKIGFPLAEK